MDLRRSKTVSICEYLILEVCLVYLVLRTHALVSWERPGWPIDVALIISVTGLTWVRRRALGDS